MNTGHGNEDLLIDYILGETTPEQNLKIEQWLHEDEANRKTYEELKMLWQHSKTFTREVRVNEDVAWQSFLQTAERKDARPRTFSMRRYDNLIKVAAMLVLLVGSSWLINYMNRQNNSSDVLSRAETPDTTPANIELTYTPGAEEIPDDTSPADAQPTVAQPSATMAATTVSAKNSTPHRPGTTPFEADCQDKRYACNSTPCPLEICIIQKNGCKNNTPVANCSVIMPDEAGKLCYKSTAEPELYSRNCNLTVEEITIKRLQTGEMIVLNDYTKVTAQDAFGYITGQKRGNVVAGVFKSDCEEQDGSSSLTIGNGDGNLHFK